jgi:hypothetical protein
MGRPPGPVNGTPLVERAHRLDDDERVPLAGAPHLLAHLFHGRRLARRARQGADELPRGATGERRHSNPLHVGFALQALDGLTEQRQIG